MLPGRLDSIAAELTVVRIDLIQYPESYYFKAADPELSLSRIFPWLLTLTRSDRLPATAWQATAEIRLALDRLAATLADGFPAVGGEGTEAILVAYAEDQRDEPVRAPG